MEYRRLGRTGMRASVMGIGAGGPSRLGQRDNFSSEAESVDLVRQGWTPASTLSTRRKATAPKKLSAPPSPGETEPGSSSRPRRASVERTSPVRPCVPA